MAMDTSEYTYRKKVYTLKELAGKTAELRAAGKTIVFTNGCFDILHRGHIQYLRESRKLGDVLIVGLNSDESVRRLKGEGRPMNPEADRAYLLEALDFVDYIVIFNENTPLELINRLKPDYYTKGGDYDIRNVIGPGLGSDIVEKYGGHVILTDFLEGYSTTSMIDK